MNRGFKNFLSTIAALLIIAMFVGLCMQLWADDKYKPTNWGKTEEDTYEGALLIGEAETSGLSVEVMSIAVEDYGLYGISPLALSASNVIIDVTGEGGREPDDGSLRLSYEFANPNSEWAKGKTADSYVSHVVNSSTNTQTKLTVTVKEAFGEQILLKAVSFDNEDKYATLPLDFVAGITSVSFDRLNSSYVADPDDEFAIYFSVSATYGVGTLKGTLEYKTGSSYYATDSAVRVVASTKIIEVIETYLNNNSIHVPSFVSGYLDCGSVNPNWDFSAVDIIRAFIDFDDLIESGWQSDLTKIESACRTALYRNKSMEFDFVSDLNYKYDGNTLSTVTARKTVTVDLSAYWTSVNGVDFGNSSGLVFWD